VVADLEVAHTVADLFDDACALVSEDAREREGDEALADAEVGVAQAGRNDPDEHLPRCGLSTSTSSSTNAA
jgi:hypothetical protein